MDKPKLVRELQTLQDELDGCINVLGDIRATTKLTITLGGVLDLLSGVAEKLDHLIEEI